MKRNKTLRHFRDLEVYQIAFDSAMKIFNITKGFPAEEKYYQCTQKIRGMTGRSFVDWGGTSKKRMNEFVTADALYVLKKSGRLS